MPIEAPHDAVQSQHRDGRPLGLRRAGRCDLRLARGPAVGAAGRAVGPGARALAHAQERRRRHVRQRASRSTAAALEPQITWGTDPSQVVGISGRVPDPSRRPKPARGDRGRARLYGARSPACRSRACRSIACSSAPAPMRGCPTSKAAAAVVRGRRVAHGVVALVVPGSSTVKREAEAKGLDRVFRDAGFFWGESGCSMCAGGNGDRGEPGERIVSTTNRNFENRQGPKVRTHLASPATAAAAAVTGRIADVRQHPGGGCVMQPFTVAYRHRRPAAQGRHQHRPDRAGAGDAHSSSPTTRRCCSRARACATTAARIRTSCSTSRSSAIPASW